MSELSALELAEMQNMEDGLPIKPIKISPEVEEPSAIELAEMQNALDIITTTFGKRKHLGLFSPKEKEQLKSLFEELKSLFQYVCEDCNPLGEDGKCPVCLNKITGNESDHSINCPRKTFPPCSRNAGGKRKSRRTQKRKSRKNRRKTNRKKN
tara:strand:+ start:132 stop:590 length:459 start_codon:yes stop_codon:yes gene_type:complete